jgi:hypothetical protein
MSLYVALVAMSKFTTLWRSIALVFLTIVSVYLGELLSSTPFFIGAMLSDLSMSFETDYSSSLRHGHLLTELLRYAKKAAPVILPITGLLFGSYPGYDSGWVPYGRFLDGFASLCFPSHCKIYRTLSNADIIYREPA